MRIGLIDVDGHNYPNLALMKISAYHKSKGDSVEWAIGFDTYDIIYQSKVFDETYTEDIDYLPIAAEIRKGGTGYFRTVKEKNKIYNEIYHEGKWHNIGLNDVYRIGNEIYTRILPEEVEHIYPDYAIYFNDNDLKYDEETGECLGLSRKEKA